ncbi:Linear gramicidin synthase subunit D [Pseudoalteromonas holothuriae]|uniref:Linear gramicidin synthase subunit D n=1 Tax=Pseudoalteromonas holothuriae TaxID=2963714 RepID=A0A9W4QTG6_9GAMM|nr:MULTISPECIES: amino acid adenylation domain-containing protein [unclassified Pseudoalteromonas]CAH9050265.1 Linear gramicidin synthase subunit D [Pseudoalteromonas sp. CIP111951]CAH9052402.1 Linear gramicidin synthase subunit D [Pseudoalteromonas sp. CIP111854]
MSNNISQLVLQLQEAGIRIESKDGKLSVSAAKGVLTPERQTMIRDNKEQLLQWLSQFEKTDKQELYASSSHPVELSFGQTRFWFMDQLEESLSAYHIVSAMTLRGQLNIPAAQRALNQIMGRHELLRTAFFSSQGKPRAELLPEVNLTINLIDLSEQSQPELLAEDEVRQAYHHQFDLSCPPLIAAKLLKLSTEQHILVFTLHHIVADAWSMSNLNREFTKNYEALVHDQQATNEPLELQYRDFVAWQKRAVSQSTLERQLEFWRNELDGLSPILPLPRRQGYTKTVNFEGDKAALTISVELTQKLAALAKSQGVTVNNLMLASFSWLLHRYSGQHDIAIGTAVSLRHEERLNPLIGLFLNYLVLRNQVDPGMSFTQLITQVQSKSLSAYANQDLPFEQLVDNLDLERSLSHQPLTQINFSYMNALTGKVALPNLQIEPYELSNDQAMFELSLSVREQHSQLNCELEFNSHYYTNAQIQALLVDFNEMLQWGSSHHHTPLFEYNSLVHRDVELIPKNAPLLHQIVEQQAQAQPNAAAVSLGYHDLTYSELNSKANQVANLLISKGVKHGDRVAIALPRDLPLTIALLAVLKTGSTYVPLDLAYPQQRLKEMLFACNANLVLTNDMQSASEAFGNSVQILDMSEVMAQATACCEQNLALAINAKTPAYIVFTSGSTGAPKGVEMSHQSLVQLVVWSSEQVAIEQRMLQYASTSFDVHCQEIFMTWYQGKHLYLIEGELTKVVIEVMSYISAFDIDTVIFPSAVLRAISNEVEHFEQLDDWLKALKNIISTAEALQFTKPLQLLLKRLPHCKLYDFYGPSETHVCLIKSYDGENSDWEQNQSLGHSNVFNDCLVLDQALSPVADEVVGELYVTGACLANGYLDNAVETAEKFIPNPYSNQPGARMYRTGDLVKRLANGEIKYVERADFMIKLRGYRIEPAEVEASLCQSDAVKQAYVVKQSIGNSEQLVAYVAITGVAFDSNVVKEALRNKLPAYMIPSQIITVESIPLNPNGKVDHSALAEVVIADESSDNKGLTPPETASEQVLVNLWIELLGNTNIGVDDDFFSVGGHSLLATQLVNIINENLGLTLSLHAIFEFATVRELSQHLGELVGGQEQIDLICEQYLQLSQMTEEELEELEQAL